MKKGKVFRVVVLSALVLLGGAIAATAQDRLVSGEPYPGFFEGVLIPANGPVYTDEVITDGPSRRVTVERASIRVRDATAKESPTRRLGPSGILG